MLIIHTGIMATSSCPCLKTALRSNAETAFIKTDYRANDEITRVFRARFENKEYKIGEG